MFNTFIRSLLYVPGDKEHMLEKALLSKGDGVIIDWEDAIAPKCKEIARNVTKEFLEHHTTGKMVFIRINDTASPQYPEDLRLAVQLPIAGIVVPKASPEGLAQVDRDLAEMDNTQDLVLIPLIESAYGLVHLEQVIAASVRIAAVQFGAEDYTRDMEITRTKTGEEVLAVRQRIGLVCQSGKILAIDTPFVDFRDSEGLNHDIWTAKQAGMKAKTAIHPGQLEQINRELTPSEEEIAIAQQIVRTAQLPENIALGAFSLNGKMVDAPVIHRAKRLLERANYFERN